MKAAAILVLTCLAAWVLLTPMSAQPTSGAGASMVASTRATPVRVLTLNVLHGLSCPPATDACQLGDRLQIFAEYVEAADCPDLIGLQEISARVEQLLPPVVATMCRGAYATAWQAAPDNPFDRVMVLSRLPIVERGFLDLANYPWEAYWVRVRSDQGPVDFLTAHFASSVNNPTCDGTRCPPLCMAGISTNECHAVQTLDHVDGREGAALTVVAGDLNAEPGEPTVLRLRRARFVDTWLKSGRPECTPARTNGCTGGGGQTGPFVGMDTRDGPGFDQRIDYVMARAGKGCDLRITTRSFAAKARAQPLNGMWWPSDHGGVLARLRCA